MRLSLLFALASPLVAFAQSSTSLSASRSSASANATAAPSNSTTGNSTLQTVTTTITSLIPVSSGSSSATSTSLLTLTLTLNASSPAPAPSNNATLNGTAPLGNDTSNANATEAAQWKEGDDWIPFYIRIDPAYGVLGALLILSGIPVAGLGGKNRWSSLAIVSGYALMLFTLVMILRFGVRDNLQPPSPSPPSTTLRGLYLLACIVAAFIGAGIGIFFFNISKYFVSAAGGFAFGWFLLATKSGGLITNVVGRWGLMGGLTVGALVVSIVPRTAELMVLVSTAWIGATAFILGVDCYTRAGLKEFYIYNLGFHSLFPKLGGAKYPLTQTMIIELGLLAAVVLIGAAIQARVLNRIKKRLREAREEEEMRIEAEEVSRAAERFKNIGSDLQEWEDKHGSGRGVVELDPSQTLHDGTSAHVPVLAREQVTTQARPSASHLPPIDTGSRALHEELQMDSPAVKRDTATPSTITFHGVEELKDESPMSRPRTGRTSPVAVDPELEEKIRLLEEVKKARESIRGSIDELRRQTPTPSIGGKLDASRPVTPSYSLGAISDGVSQPRMYTGSHEDELDLRNRRASAASSRVLDGPDSARVRHQSTSSRLVDTARSRDSFGGSAGDIVSSQSSPSDWDRYVSDRKITTPPGPMDARARYPPQDASDRRGMTLSMIDLSGPTSSQTSSEDRRTRATSMSFPGEEPGPGQFHSLPQARSRDSHSRMDSYVPGQVTGSAASHGPSTAANPRAQSRSMTYEELSDRHRRRISALQSTVTDKTKEEEKVKAARERWERQRREEKAEMERKERQATAAKSNKKDKVEQRQEVLQSTDEWRRSVHTGLDQLGRPVQPPAHPRDRSQSHAEPTKPRGKRMSRIIN